MLKKRLISYGYIAKMMIDNEFVEDPNTGELYFLGLKDDQVFVGHLSKSNVRKVKNPTIDDLGFVEDQTLEDFLQGFNYCSHFNKTWSALGYTITPDTPIGSLLASQPQSIRFVPEFKAINFVSLFYKTMEQVVQKQEMRDKPLVVGGFNLSNVSQLYEDFVEINLANNLKLSNLYLSKLRERRTGRASKETLQRLSDYKPLMVKFKGVFNVGLDYMPDIYGELLDNNVELNTTTISGGFIQEDGGKVYYIPIGNFVKELNVYPSRYNSVVGYTFLNCTLAKTFNRLFHSSTEKIYIRRGNNRQMLTEKEFQRKVNAGQISSNDFISINWTRVMLERALLTYDRTIDITDKNTSMCLEKVVSVLERS